MQPKPPRAPKQRSRADSDEDELDAAEQKKIETLARAQSSEEMQREVSVMRDASSSDDESEDDTWEEVVDAIIDTLNDLSPGDRRNDDTVAEAARVAVRRSLRDSIGKRPVTDVHVVRV